jgi:hypothetical protein
LDGAAVTQAKFRGFFEWLDDNDEFATSDFADRSSNVDQKVLNRPVDIVLTVMGTINSSSTLPHL